MQFSESMNFTMFVISDEHIDDVIDCVHVFRSHVLNADDTLNIFKVEFCCVLPVNRSSVTFSALAMASRWSKVGLRSSCS